MASKVANDVIGLSDDEGEDTPQDSSLVGGSKDIVSSLREGSKGPKSQSQSITASMGSKGGFRPMGEFGTETVQLDEAADGDELGIDVVGLSDDEDELNPPK